MQEEMGDGLDENNGTAMFEEDDEGLKNCHVKAGYRRKLTLAQLKQATISGTIPTIIANIGASSTCVVPNDE
jgi:hypothetical protein